jgi:hypothetical protein
VPICRSKENILYAAGWTEEQGLPSGVRAGERGAVGANGAAGESGASSGASNPASGSSSFHPDTCQRRHKSRVRETKDATKGPSYGGNSWYKDSQSRFHSRDCCYRRYKIFRKASTEKRRDLDF